MAFNFGSLATAIGRALPGYVDGERRAIQDNWQDLDNFNKVQAGQLQNAWTEATWEPRFFNTWAGAAANDMALMQSGMTLANDIAAQQGNQTRAWGYSYAAPDLYLGPYGYFSRMAEMYRRMPQFGGALPDPGAGMGNTPSGLR